MKTRGGHIGEAIGRARIGRPEGPEQSARPRLEEGDKVRREESQREHRGEGSTATHRAGDETTGAVAEDRREGVVSKVRPQGGGGQLSYGRGHRVAHTGTIAWCVRCGAHAEKRVGTALSGECNPIAEAEKSGRAYRRSLLLKGLHPITRNRLE